MPDDALLAETNRLLRTILENDAEARRNADESMAKHHAEMAEMDAKRKEAMKERLREQGLPEEAITGSDEDWETLRKARHKETEERLEQAKARELRYKEDLLAELRIQSDLLRRIAERLER